MFCQKRKVELFCGSAFCSAVFFIFFPPLFLSHRFFFLFFFTLNWAAKKKGKKGVKNQQKGSIRSSSVYEVFFQAFEEKHLSGGGMRPNCSQSLLILPVQSPNRAEGEGGGAVAGSCRHLTLTFCLRSCPLKVGLFSLSYSEAQCRATV